MRAITCWQGVRPSKNAGVRNVKVNRKKSRGGNQKSERGKEKRGFKRGERGRGKTRKGAIKLCSRLLEGAITNRRPGRHTEKKGQKRKGGQSPAFWGEMCKKESGMNPAPMVKGALKLQDSVDEKSSPGRSEQHREKAKKKKNSSNWRNG